MEGGLDLEKQTSLPVEAELFFLTSLFIELIDCSLFVGAQGCAFGRSLVSILSSALIPVVEGFSQV